MKKLVKQVVFLLVVLALFLSTIAAIYPQTQVVSAEGALVKITSVKQIGASIVINGILDCAKYGRRVDVHMKENKIYLSVYAIDPSPKIECGTKKAFSLDVILPLQKWKSYKVYVNGKYWLTFK